jgi:hypothetical protein
VRSRSSVAPACSAFLIVIAFVMSSSVPHARQTRDEPTLSRAASWVTPNIAMALVEEDFEQTVVDQRQTLGVRMGALEMPPRFKLNVRKVHSELVFAQSAGDQTWHVGRRILIKDGQSLPRREPTAEAIVSGGLHDAITEIDALQDVASLFYAGSSNLIFDYPTWPFDILNTTSRPRFSLTSSASRISFDEQAHDALNRASGVLSLNKGGRMTRAELHIHFPGAAERLTAEFTVDPESHVLTPTKMAERYKHVLEDVSAVAVYSHFRWFDSEGRSIAPLAIQD